MTAQPIRDRAENWTTSLVWCCVAEAAAAIEDRGQAALARERLRPEYDAWLRDWRTRLQF